MGEEAGESRREQSNSSFGRRLKVTLRTKQAEGLGLCAILISHLSKSSKWSAQIQPALCKPNFVLFL